MLYIDNVRVVHRGPRPFINMLLREARPPGNPLIPFAPSSSVTFHWPPMGEHEARQKHALTYYVATRNPSYTPLSSAAQALLLKHSCDRPPYHRSEGRCRGNRPNGPSPIENFCQRSTSSDLLLFSSGMQIQSQTTLRGSRVLVNVTRVQGRGACSIPPRACLCSL